MMALFQIVVLSVMAIRKLRLATIKRLKFLAKPGTNLSDRVLEE